MVVSGLMSLLIGHGPEQLNINKPVIMEGIQKSGAQVSEKLHKRRFRTGKSEDLPRAAEKGNGKSSSKSVSLHQCLGVSSPAAFDTRLRPSDPLMGQVWNLHCVTSISNDSGD